MDLKELSFDRLGSWPIRVRIIVLAGAFIFTLALGYLVLSQPRLKNLNHLEKQQAGLKLRYFSDYKQAATLPEYEEQLAKIQKDITTSSKQLTTVNEMPLLLSTISRLATENNLKISSIKPEQESARNFYVAMPISISVTGDYHHLALFMSQVEFLQKTVTFDDLTITTVQGKASDDSGLMLLMMNTTAIVYMPNALEGDSTNIATRYKTQ